MIQAGLQALEHSLRQIKSQNALPEHGTTNIVPSNKKTINPNEELLDLLSSSRFLIRFLSHSPRNKTSFTIELSFVNDPKGLVSKKNLFLYPQVSLLNE